MGSVETGESDILRVFPRQYKPHKLDETFVCTTSMSGIRSNITATTRTLCGNETSLTRIMPVVSRSSFFPSLVSDEYFANIYGVFRNLWDPLRELNVRLKIMKKSHINICPICPRL